MHGSAPKYKGKNKVNPTATILSGVLMLRHIGKIKEANKIESAVKKVIAQGKKVTYDINSKKPVGTKEMTEEIIRKI